jgi:hypothetical protein
MRLAAIGASGRIGRCIVQELLAWRCWLLLEEFRDGGRNCGGVELMALSGADSRLRLGQDGAPRAVSRAHHVPSAELTIGISRALPRRSC